jgi:hypothetical protein
MRDSLAARLMIAIPLGLITPAVTAVPYASAITDLGGGDYSFVLNEDADNVVVRRIGSMPLVLGPLARGTHTFNIGIVAGFEIWVGKSAAVGWTQISDNDWNGVKFYSPKGVDVNRNPASPCFGWIYVAESLGGTTGGRTTTDGIYALLADCTDAIGQGDTAVTGGEDWTTDAAGSSPWRLHTIEGDDGVYVCDWSDSHSGLWRFDSDLSDSATAVLDPNGIDANGLNETHGSIADFVGEYSECECLVLYTLDEDMGINAGVGGFVGKYSIDPIELPHSGAPAQVADFGDQVVNGTLGLCGFWWDPDRKPRLYWAQYRWDDDAPSFMIFDEANDPNDPNVIYSLTDVNLAYRGGVQVDAENERIILGGYYGDFTIRDLNDPAVVLANPGPNGYTRAVAYDAAGNVYAVNSSTERLTVWAPGGNTVTVTGADGTFQVYCHGDLDNDNDIDLADLAQLLGNYGETAGMVYEDGDLDGDGDVDLADLAALLGVYGTACE